MAGILEEFTSSTQTPATEIEPTHSLEFDMCQAKWLVDKVRNDQSYAQNLYAALCNNEFQELELFEVLRGRAWSCTWRYAGGIVADMRGEGGDYLDWYCSGMGPGGNGNGHNNDPKLHYVGEGTITDEIRADLARLGWQPVVEE